MTDPLATTVILDIRVERSAKPMACDTCGLRRITYAIVLQPLLLPARWRCADCAGIRIPTLSGDPRPLAGDPVLWPEDPADFLLEEARASVALDSDEGGAITVKPSERGLA